MNASREFLERRGLPGRDPVECPTSTKRFPDGGQYRIEIPSTEGPRSLAAVLEEAAKRRVPVHRVSQGSGIMLMTDDEISEMLSIGRQAGIEVIRHTMRRYGIVGMELTHLMAGRRTAFYQHAAAPADGPRRAGGPRGASGLGPDGGRFS